jgi:hypothetical protein
VGLIRRFYERRWENMSPDEQLAAQNELAERQAADAARREQALAQADAAHEQSQRETIDRRQSQVLDGPAGDYIHGKLAEPPKPSDIAANPQSTGDGFRQAFRGLKDTARDLADPMGPLVIGSDMPAGIADPVERAAVAANERRLRDDARARYLASPVPPVTITRIATRGRTQHDEVAHFLASNGIAARPDLVYGVFRVPDRVSPLMPGSEDGRVVEWAVVHRAPAGAATHAPQWSTFDADKPLVARTDGQPSVLDEDVAITALAATGLGPQHCLGISREIRMEQISGWVSDSEHAGNPVYARVTGVRVLTPHATLPATTSVPVPLGGQPGVHVEVMNWSAVGQAVHPRPQRGPEIPSPFPYLPATPEELLVAYLQILGIDPADCYTASTTIDEFFAMGERTTKDIERISLDDLKASDAEELPCADGKARRRYHGATHIVVAYLDRPEYAAGPDRWARYQSEVLQARLSLRTGARRPVGGDGSRLDKVVDAIDGVGNFVNRLTLQSPTAYERYGGKHRYIGR